MINITEILNHLKTLNVPTDVDFSLDDVKQAYRYMANLYHPDKKKTQESDEKMKSINQSYEWIVRNFDEIKKVDLSTVSTKHSKMNQTDVEKEFNRKKEELLDEIEELSSELKELSINKKFKKTMLAKLEYFKARVYLAKKIADLDILKDELDQYIDKIEQEYDDEFDDEYDDEDEEYDDEEDSYNHSDFNRAKYFSIGKLARLPMLLIFLILRQLFGLLKIVLAFKPIRIIVFLSVTVFLVLAVISWFAKDTYQVNYELNGGVNHPSNKSDLIVGENFLLYNPQRVGYEFVGWYLDSGLEGDSITNILLNDIDEITIYAKWNLIYYSISYVLNGGINSEQNVSQYSYESETINFAIPTKNGYNFAGWYTDLSFTNEIFTLSENTFTNLTLYAKWEPIYYLLTYELDGGINNSLNPSAYHIESGIITLMEPTRTGYSFFAWYLNEDLTGDSVTSISSDEADDLILYAKWIINSYTISFETNGSEIMDNITLDFNDQITNLIEPEKDYYIFSGWYLNSNLTLRFNDITMPAENITLYAKWEPVMFLLIYELNGGVNHHQNPNEYNIESGVVNFLEPTKTGHSFVGWFLNEDLSENPIANITADELSDITLYAKWNINTYTISYFDFIDFDATTFIPLYAEEKIIIVSLGEWHTIALTSLGRVFAWGSNGYGQLGDGTKNELLKPTEITSSFNLENEIIIKVEAGEFFSGALTSTGRVFTWGWNFSGQLGNGTFTDSSLPIDITSNFNLAANEDITNISLGGRHSAAITSLGRVFTWGSNGRGQLGNGAQNDSRLPIDITNRFNLENNDQIVEVDLGGKHSSALASNSQVFVWGDNDYGQVGDGAGSGPRTSPVNISHLFDLVSSEIIIKVSMASSSYYANNSSAISSTGRVFTWGANESGQIGDGSTIRRFTPQDITGNFNLSHDDKIIDISLGSASGISISLSGRVFTWGSNSSSQLGDGTDVLRRTLPTEITENFSFDIGEVPSKVNYGGSHVSVLTANGNVWMWGSNIKGQLGNGTTTRRGFPEKNIYFTYPLPRTTSTHIFNSNILYIPEKLGYTFAGWYINPSLSMAFTENKMPAYDVILYGKWIKN